jgi:hypothetical protein
VPNFIHRLKAAVAAHKARMKLREDIAAARLSGQASGKAIGFTSGVHDDPINTYQQSPLYRNTYTDPAVSASYEKAFRDGVITGYKGIQKSSSSPTL